MAITHFQPKAGRYGVQNTHVEFGNAGPISPVAVASSTVVYRTGTPLRKAYVDRIGLLIGTLAAGSAAITAQFFLRNSVGSKNVALTATFDLKTGSTLTVRNVPITATEVQRNVLEGDYLAVDIVAAGTITQQPVDLFAMVELDILE